AVLGTMLSTASFAQERSRSPGLDGARPAAPMGQMRGPGGPVRGIRQGHDERGARAENFIEHNDTNADGEVSEAEFTDAQLQHIDVLFERRDTDDNGQISRSEHEARGPRGRGGPGNAERPARPERPLLDQAALTACVPKTVADYAPRERPSEDGFDTADTDNDRSLSLAEVSAQLEARVLQRFDRLDADANGFVTAAEVTAQNAAQLTLRRAVQACVRQQAPAAR
ncbi:MAG: hypothetical protein RLZZ227_2830, partial [Pseudomonadota bacterium]